MKADGCEDAVVELEVRERVGMNAVPSVRNRNLGGLTVSDVMEERPDPLMKIADNDMNTLMPVTLDYELRTGYRNGWRIYPQPR